MGAVGLSDAVPLSERSWWLREAADGLTSCPALNGSVSADVCIVGGGFTGLWTAIRIKELDPAAEVLLLEADLCGSGASGRNGGFAMTFWHQYLALERVCGSAEAIRLAQASTQTVGEIEVFCAQHGIDAHFRCQGWFWVASNPAQLGAWERTVSAVERDGLEPFVRLDADDLQARTGSVRHLGGVFEPAGATVQPARLALGLRRVALEHGVAIHEGSPMVALERAAVLSVRTPGGSVRAGRVVLAMNAWATEVRELRRGVVTVASDMVITDPVPQRLQELRMPDGLSISDSRLMVHYYRTTNDGRLAFGKGGGRLAYGPRIGARYDGPSPRADWVTSQLRATYPQLADVPIAGSWTGPVDRTIDGIPFFTALGRPDLVCGLGYSGNGVAPSALGGRILASLALGREDDYSRCGLVRRPPKGLPPEPLRYAGGRLVQAAVRRKEQAADDHRTARKIDVALTRLAPNGLVPTE